MPSIKIKFERENINTEVTLDLLEEMIKRFIVRKPKERGSLTTYLQNQVKGQPDILLKSTKSFRDLSPDRHNPGYLSPGKGKGQQQANNQYDPRMSKKSGQSTSDFG